MSEDGVLGNGRIFFSALSKETVSSICSVFFISRESVHCPGTVFHQLFKTLKCTLHGYFLLLYYVLCIMYYILVLSTLATLVQSILLLVDCEINLSIKLPLNIVTTIACILLGNPFKRYLLMLHSPQALSRLFLVIFYFLLLHY